MTKYVYKIGNEEVTREKFSRFIAEDCEPKDGGSWAGFGVSIADYAQGEKVTKSIEGKAYRDYKKSLEWKGPRKYGQATTIYAGVKPSGVVVEYWPNGKA